MSNTLENQKLDIAQAKKVFETLSAIDVTPKLENKNGASYLSWAHAWEIVLKEFPLAHYEFGPEKVFNDGSMEVNVEVTIHGMTRSMFLPVMTGFKNAAKANPDARDIGDAKVRCLVKCLAMFGLGLYVYRGEGLPEDAGKPSQSSGKKQSSGSQKQSKPSAAKASASKTTNSSPTQSGSSKGNSLDAKLITSKQMAGINRGIDTLSKASDMLPEKIKAGVTSYINKRRAAEDQPEIKELQEMRYFDAERVIKYLAPKVKKANVALAEAVGE